ncbi:hypothetical protein WJX73_006706 [Symbiochloris irregularis]|uniref:Protein kinase domain-containing protein n=1 Tax=Symbiochloris irregularis TaxID=706552 RepID=A0AAW1NTP7_9CHLO
MAGRQGQVGQSGPADFYWSIPPVTRTHVTAVVLSTLLTRFGLLSPSTLYLHWPSVFKLEVWRLVTTYTFLGGFSFNWLMEVLWIVQYGKALETVTHQFSPADHIYMYLFGMVCMLPISLVLNVYFFASPFVFMLLWVWSREFPNNQVSIFGLFNVQSFYLPFVFLAMSLLKGGWQFDAIGIVVGHLYYFLKRLHPRQGGRDILATPVWLQRMTANWGIGAPSVREATMHSPQAATSIGPGFRAFSGQVEERASDGTHSKCDHLQTSPTRSGCEDSTRLRAEPGTLLPSILICEAALARASKPDGRRLLVRGVSNLFETTGASIHLQDCAPGPASLGHPQQVKVVCISDAEARQALCQEYAQLQAGIAGSGVVTFHALLQQGQHLLMISQYMAGKDLRGALTHDHKQLLHWDALGVHVALEVCQAVNRLHSQQVVHRHLRSSNVLLAQPLSGTLPLSGSTVALADTGLSAMLDAHNIRRKVFDHDAWAAPEVLLGDKCTVQADIYSYGILLWELVTGEVPLRGKLRPPVIPQECPQMVADLIEACMQHDPAARPTAQQICTCLQSAKLQRPEDASQQACLPELGYGDIPGSRPLKRNSPSSPLDLLGSGDSSSSQASGDSPRSSFTIPATADDEDTSID